MCLLNIVFRARLLDAWRRWAPADDYFWTNTNERLSSKIHKLKLKTGKSGRAKHDREIFIILETGEFFSGKESE